MTLHLYERSEVEVFSGTDSNVGWNLINYCSDFSICNKRKVYHSLYERSEVEVFSGTDSNEGWNPVNYYNFRSVKYDG